jgi:catechol 2,3-dioxygenase-like lactoylglutathione lyase family enzyme
VIGRLHSLVLDCPEPDALAEFYSELLGLPRLADGPDWAAIGADRPPAITFQRVLPYTAPTWPDATVPTQLHVDVLVDDLDQAERRVLRLGAALLEGSDKPVGYRVYADPAGHPFCLVTPESIPWHPPK